MVWFWLQHVPGETIHATVYTEQLQQFMLGSAPVCFKNRQFIFQQDNARPNTANATKAWLKKRKIPLLDWPAKPPGMNPIEQMWWKIKSIRPFPVADTVEGL